VTTLEISPVERTVPSRLVRARDVLAFEWTKLRSLRSNRWTLLIAAVEYEPAQHVDPEVAADIATWLSAAR